MPKLSIDIEARLAQFQDSLDKIGRHGEAVGKRLEDAFSGLKGTLAGFAGVLSVGALANFVRSGIDAADNLGKLSQKVGVTVESLSALKYAAELSDVSLEQLQTGLQKLARNAVDTQAGAGEAADAFKALAVNVSDARGQLKSTEALLLEVAERFSRIEDGAGKTALAIKIFGKNGAELIPLLNQGRTGIEAMRKEAERLGIILSGDMSRASEKFNDDMKRLEASGEKLKFQLADNLLPALNRVAAAMVEASLNGEGLIGKIKALGQLSPATDLFKAEREIVELTDELLSTQKEIERRSGKGSAEELTALRENAASTEKRLREVIKLRGFLSGETDVFGDPVKSTDQPKKKAPPLPDKDTDEKFEAFKRKLQEEAIKGQELNRYQEVLLELEDKRFAKFSPKRREELLQLAAKVALNREDVRVQREADQAADESGKREQDALRAADERLTRIAESALDSIDNTRAWRREVDGLVEAFEKGLLTIQQLNQASTDPRLRALLEPRKTDRDILNEAIKEGDIDLDKYNEAIKRLNSDGIL